MAETFPFSAGTAGTATSISLYVDSHSTARTLIVGLYSNANGRPGSQLTAGSISSPTPGAWNSVTVKSTSVASTGKYWLAILGERGTIYFRDRFNGPCSGFTSSQSNLRSLAANWRSDQEWQDCPVSAYVSGSSLSSGSTGGGSGSGGSGTTGVAPTNTAPPALTGPTTAGRSLSTSDGFWAGAPTSYSYQWEDCNSAGGNCSMDSGASTPSYALSSATVGRTVRSVVTVSNATGLSSATSAPSPPIASDVPAPPTTTASPVVAGTADVGNTLATSDGSWTGSPLSYGYQWQDCDTSGANCSDILGAVLSSYTVSSGDIGRTIRSVVTALGLGGSGFTDSAPTSVVTATIAQAPSNTAAPTASGQAIQGQTLSVTTGTWANAPISYTYAWQDCDRAGANCATISGATSTTYSLTSSDVGNTIRAVVTASNAAGSTAASAGATSTVTAAASRCTVTASTVSAVNSAVSAAADGDVICVTAGSYSGFTLTRTGSHSSNVTVEPVVGADPNGAGKVTVGLGATDSGGRSVAVEFRPGTNHVALHGFYVTDTINVEPGASYITVDHNDISGGSGGFYGEGINVGSVDCSAPHAPSYSGCQSYSPVSYLTISGNKIHGFGSPTEDAIHMNNWQHVHVTGNDLYGLEESGNHTDNLQSVWGGMDITFDHNYEHDSQAQGFFLSNGDVVGATVTDNLMVRQNNKGLGEVQIQIGSTHSVVVEKNTVWADSGSDAVRSYDNVPTSCGSDPYCSTAAYNATVDHNVMETLTNYQSGDPAHVAMTESANIFQQSPTTFSSSSSDTISSNPGFACGSSCGNGTLAGDNYQLVNNPTGIGIDWSPANQSYGP